MKTSELTGAALDRAVARACGIHAFNFSPSTDWAQGGPIIEREGMCLHMEAPNDWRASMWWDDENSSGDLQMRGPTPLIAAMRCYVASKLGDDVEVPAELLTA